MVNLSLQLEPNADGNHVYLAGQAVKGVVKLSLDASKKFRALYILIKGKCEIHWTETHEEGTGDSRRTVTEHFRNKEIYLDSKTILFGQIGGSSIEVSAGLHQYEFLCPLPPFLPYSLKAKHGKIEYSIETVLDVPWRFNKQCSVPFIVGRFDDMNLRNDLKFGQASEDMKTFCCCFCSSEPLLLKASIPVMGYAAGKNIPIEIEYNNRSDSDVIRTEVKLKKIVRFTSSTPHAKTKSIPETILEIFTDGVAKKSSNKALCYLTLPTIMHTSNEHCTRILQVTYELEITAKVSGIHTNLSVKLPIFVGTSPIILATNNDIRNDCYVQPTAPFYDREMDYGPAFYECNDREIFDPPPPYSAISTTVPVHSSSNFNQVHQPSISSQNEFYSTHVHANVNSIQSYQCMPTVQLTQDNWNSNQSMNAYPNQKF